MTRNGSAVRQMFDVYLKCGHVAHYPSPPPRHGDVLLCRRCDDYADVHYYVTRESTSILACQ